MCFPPQNSEPGLCTSVFSVSVFCNFLFIFCIVIPSCIAEIFSPLKSFHQGHFLDHRIRMYFHVQLFQTLLEYCLSVANQVWQFPLITNVKYNLVAFHKNFSKRKYIFCMEQKRVFAQWEYCYRIKYTILSYKVKMHFYRPYETKVMIALAVMNHVCKGVSSFLFFGQIFWAAKRRVFSRQKFDFLQFLLSFQFTHFDSTEKKWEANWIFYQNLAHSL